VIVQIYILAAVSSCLIVPCFFPSLAEERSHLSLSIFSCLKPIWSSFAGCRLSQKQRIQPSPTHHPLPNPAGTVEINSGALLTTRTTRFGFDPDTGHQNCIYCWSNIDRDATEPLVTENLGLNE
jgi:hypothetical protein